MKKIKALMLTIVIFLAVILSGCSLPLVAKSASNQEPASATASSAEKAELIILKGEIDSLKQAEAIIQNAETVFTLIGVKDGNGAIITGIHPGLAVGKKIKITLKKTNINYKGTTIFEVVRIEPVSEL